MAKNVPSALNRGKEFYDLTLPVFPVRRGAIEPDIMLIQYLVRQFLFSERSIGKDRLQGLAIMNRVTKSGNRWDDGVYGSNTREATRLFEKMAQSPVKDGVFRPVSNGSGAVAITTLNPRVKLNVLNTVLDENSVSRSTNRLDLAFESMNPLLRKILHQV